MGVLLIEGKRRIIAGNPERRSSPEFVRLPKACWDLPRACSRRTNVHRRVDYQVLVEQQVIEALRMWSRHEQYRQTHGTIRTEGGFREVSHGSAMAQRA